jgi:hypothetical protein
VLDKEAAYAVRLPASGFHQFFRCGATGPFQQFQELLGLTAFAVAYPPLLQWLFWATARFFEEVTFFPGLALETATRDFRDAVLAGFVTSGFSVVTIYER